MKNIVSKKMYVTPEMAVCTVDCVLCTAGSGEPTNTSNWENDKENWGTWTWGENV